ncbi:MAG: insecticidal delta-endotoxin Cry8Ea1 family protein [Chloroflexota bacterium]
MIDINNWPAEVKDVAHDVVGAIPEVGLLLNLVLDVFWPSTGTDIWGQVKEQVESTVQKDLLKHEIQTIEGKLKAIHDSLRNYTDYSVEYRQDPKRNAGDLQKMRPQLSSMIMHANDLFDRIENSDQQAHLIPYLVALAPLELSILREQYSHGKLLFGFTSKADLKHLKEKYKRYQNLFPKLFTEWKSWREKQIVYESKHGFKHVKDLLTKQRVFMVNSVSEKGIAQGKKMFLRNAIAGMANTLSGAFYLHNFLPDIKNYDEPVYIAGLGTISLGPFSWDVGWGRDYNSIKDRPGRVDSLQIQHGTEIDGIQVTYASHKGRFFGSNSGQKTIIDVLQQNKGDEQVYVAGMIVSGDSNKSFMCGIQPILVRKTTTNNKSQFIQELAPWYGTHHSSGQVGAIAPNYRLSSVSATPGGRIADMEFFFEFVPKIEVIELQTSGYSSKINESAPILVNGLPISQPVPLRAKNRRRIKAIEVITVRLKDGAIKFQRTYHSTDANEIWKSLHTDVEKLKKDQSNNGDFFFLTSSGLRGKDSPQHFPDFANLLTSIGASIDPRWFMGVVKPNWPYWWVTSGQFGAKSQRLTEYKQYQRQPNQCQIKLYLRPDGSIYFKDSQSGWPNKQLPLPTSG